jgi:transcriptional regulator with XRE-family HTH domain
MSDTSLSDRLDEAMRLRDVSAYAIWQRTGISQSTIGRLRKGQRHSASHQALDKIARALGVRLEWLTSGRGPMEPQDTLEELIARATPLDLAIAVERDRISETARAKVLRWAEETEAELDTWGWIAILRDVQRQLSEGVPRSKITFPSPGNAPKIDVRIEKVS